VRRALPSRACYGSDRFRPRVRVRRRGDPRRPRELARALASLVAQDLRDWEAIVVDDGGGEGVEAAGALGDPRIAAFRSPGAGQRRARRRARGARGDVFCWLDDDDWWDDPGHLSLLRREAEARPGFWFRGGWIVRDGGVREVFDHEATARSLRRNNTVLTSSIAYPRALPTGSARSTARSAATATGTSCCGCATRASSRISSQVSASATRSTTERVGRADAPARREGFERFARARTADRAREPRPHPPAARERRLGRDEAGLEREFRFDDFAAAIAFVNRVAELAESENHHPDIDVRWNKVTLRWITHSAGGITDRDRELAGARPSSSDGATARRSRSWPSTAVAGMPGLAELLGGVARYHGLDADRSATTISTCAINPSTLTSVTTPRKRFRALVCLSLGAPRSARSRSPGRAAGCRRRARS
jgi:4a-hydroxytetrahydrobiopterin dehydratase